MCFDLTAAVGKRHDWFDSNLQKNESLINKAISGVISDNVSEENMCWAYGRPSQVSFAIKPLKYYLKLDPNKLAK